MLLRAEVQNAVDAGALASALEMRSNPDDIEAAEEAARRYVQLNRAGAWSSIPEDAILVERGQFDGETGTFTATDFSPNAVRVYARQDNQPFLFGRIFGRTTYAAPASAIASGASRQMDIMLVLDLSGSMEDSGRIEALWNAAPVFVEVIEDCGGDDQIGVMGLSANPDDYDPNDEGHSGVEYFSGLHPTADHNVGVLEAELSDDFEHLENAVLASDNLQAGKYTRYTGTGAAIGDAAHYLTYGSEARPEAEKYIVLMSDGEANRPSDNGSGYALEMARYADRQDVKIYTVSLGDAADVDLMQAIAEAAGGEHFDATGAGEAQLTERLTTAFKEIATAIKRVQLVQ
jgi:hypothetical protein